MKAFSIIAKIVVALAAVAGAIYVIATYGETIAAWCKKVLRPKPTFTSYYETDEDADEEPIEDVPADGVADEADFE